MALVRLGISLIDFFLGMGYVGDSGHYATENHVPCCGIDILVKKGNLSTKGGEQMGVSLLR